MEYARRSAAESAAATVSKAISSSFIEFAQEKKLLKFWWDVKRWNSLTSNRPAYFTRHHLVFSGPKCGSSIGHCLLTRVQSWAMQLGNQLSNWIHSFLMNSYYHLQWLSFKYDLSMNCPLVHVTAVFFSFCQAVILCTCTVFTDSKPSISKFANQPFDYDPSSTNNHPCQFNIFWCYCCQFGSASHFQQFQSCPCWRGSERKRRCCCGQNGGRAEFSTATKVWILLGKLKVF